MIWKGWWHGITIIAETDEDKELLLKLEKLLPKDADELYEVGELHINKEENSITFDR